MERLTDALQEYFENINCPGTRIANHVNENKTCY